MEMPLLSPRLHCDCVWSWGLSGGDVCREILRVGPNLLGLVLF